MQQHSQIIELKDRLVQALDEQLNVKDTNEVNRIISILEQTHVTREDLEKTRLGKYINDLRKRTADKDLAKRAKKLIKLWRDLTVGGGGGGGNGPSSNNNISALTSPFNSISPHGYNSNNNNNVGVKNCKLNTTPTTTTFYDSKLTPPSSHHPALLRVKNQHGRLVSPQEKTKSYGHSSLSPALLSPVSHNNNNNSSSSSKTNVSFRCQAQKNASPQPQNNNNNNELTNGHHHHHSNHDKSPNNSYQKRIASNGLSPGLQNSKQHLAKDGISPNAYYRNRRVTPPTPNNGDMANVINNQQHLLSPSSTTSSSLSPLIHRSSSAPSSQLCSPLAFTYSNESRDSFTTNTTTTTQNHHPNNNKNNSSYSNHHHHQQQHATNFDLNDEDSNSSQFSSISSNDYSAKTVDDQHRKRSRKRKVDDENDTLRENFNYVNYGGRRPQSTEELIEKFNLKLDPKIMKRNDSNQLESYSASSSPALSKADGDLKSNVKQHTKNGGSSFYSASNRNGFHSEENSLDGFDGGVVSPENNHNVSPPVRSKHKKDGFAAASSTWSRSKYHDDAIEENSYEEEEEEFDDYNQSVIESPQTCDQTIVSPLTGSKTSEPDTRKKPKWIKSITKIEQEINEIICKLPKINPDDIALMQQLSWDSEQEDDGLAKDQGVDQQEAGEKAHDQIGAMLEAEGKTSDETYDDDDEEEEYEPYEYYEEYDEEIEVEISDDDEDEKKENDDDDDGDGDGDGDGHNDENVSNFLSDNEESSFSDEKKSSQTNTLCDTIKCDKTTTNLNGVDISVDPDRTESMSVDDGGEKSLTITAAAEAEAASSPLSASTTNNVLQHDDDHTSSSLQTVAINVLDDSSTDPEKISHETSSIIIENNLKTDESKKKKKKKENDQQQIEGTTAIEPYDETNGNVMKAEDLKNFKKSSKKIIKQVVKKRKRCLGRLKVKKSLVDRLANERWDGYNGCYDKDGIWREWNEMTSVYVLTGGENANNHSEENVLHILPYVNCSW